MYPNWKKGIKVALIAGSIAALLDFAFSYWISRQPAITDVSLTWSFRPWWRLSNWMFAFGTFVVVGTIFGLLAAFRPNLKKR
jgi:hypothetical protein